MADPTPPQKPEKRVSREAAARAALTAPVSDIAREALGMGKFKKPGEDAAIKALLTAPPSAEAMSALKGEDVQYQNFVKALLRPSTNTEDSLSPGEEFAELTPEQVLRKGVLTELDILRAPPSEEAMAALSVGILKNRDGSATTYLTGKALSDMMSNPMGAGDLLKNFKLGTMKDAQRDIAKQYLGQMVEIKPGELHPGLVKRMSTNPETAMFANYAITAGNAAGINGIMYANQLWQESRFNEDAVSGAGARGIAQIMPKYFMGKYGLNSIEDFHDGYKSIEAGARIMFDMTNKYKDQRLALVAYNGGEDAINFVETKLGKGQITYNDWYKFMEERRVTNPTSKPGAWQNETFDYLNKTGAGKPGDAPPAKAATPELTLK